MAEFVQLTHTAQQVDDAVDAVATKADQEALQAEATVRTAADNELKSDLTQLETDLCDIQNMNPLTFFNQTVSGTQSKTVTGLSISAGTYDVSVDNVISSDTDSNISSVAFVSNGTTINTVNFDRNIATTKKITFSANVDSIIFYASNSWLAGTGDSFTYTGVKITQDSVLNKKINGLETGVENIQSELSYGLDDGEIVVAKDVVWQSGYINTSGLIVTSSVAAFALVKMSKGETVEIGTTVSNITVIGSTTAESVSVGDSVTPIQKTFRTTYTKYSYTALADINIVICVNRSDYNVRFYKEAFLLQSITDGCIKGEVVSNGSFSSNGSLSTDRTNRIRSDFIAFRAYDKIVIENGSLQHAVGMWSGTPSTATVKRNDSAFITTDETIIPDYDGYIVIVFKKTDDSNMVLSDFDGRILLYQTIGYRAYVSANNYGAYDIPTYYLDADYLKNKANRINALGKLGDDTFCFITDVHWERNAKHSPDLIKYIANKCALFKAFNGGDVADASMLTAYNKYRSAIKTVYHVAGNHDYFSPTTGRDLYYCMDSANNKQIGSPFEHYWYVDNVQLKIRYIILNTFTRADGATTITNGYDETQLAWLQDTALSLPGVDWDVIILTHILKTTTPSVANSALVESIIDAFNAEQTHMGKILAVFQGHTHWDAVYHTEGGVPVITTTCDKWDLSNETSTIPAEGIAWREKNTIKEQAFDVVVLNREERKFTCVRIGAPAQNNIDKYRTDTGFTWIGTLEEREITY